MAKFQSEWQEYIGISNVTATDGVTPTISVAIPEFNPTEDNSLGEKIVFNASTEDKIGGTGGSAKVAKVKTLVCTYRGFGDTNGLIPCVHRGERVRVFNYAGTEQYYWTPFGRDPGLRKHERVRWFAMDKGEPSVDNPPSYQDVTDYNNYFVEINTNPNSKCIRIHTGVSDGEELTYDIAIYPEECCLEITDNMSGGNVHTLDPNRGSKMDAGNCIRLESKKHWWHIRNVDDSIIDVKRENITLTCKDTITLNAGKHIVTKCGQNYRSTVGANRIENIGTKSTTFCPDIEKYTTGVDLGELSRLNATVNDDSATAVAPLPGNNAPGGSHEIFTTPLIDTHSEASIINTSKTLTNNIDSSITSKSGSINASASGAMSLSGSSSCSISGAAIQYKGAHTFTGANFTVATGHGVVPVVIVYGSNSW